MYMNPRLAYIIIPIIFSIILFIGKAITIPGLAWYATLNQPPLTPPNNIFSIVWFIIYCCTALSLLLFWRTREKSKHANIIIALFCINAITHLLWSVLFFSYHQIKYALYDCIIIEGTIVLLLALLIRTHIKSALLLLPYALWVGFALYLNAGFLYMNT